MNKAEIPIIHVIGEADTAIPPSENSNLVEERYKNLGGKITVRGEIDRGFSQRAAFVRIEGYGV